MQITTGDSRITLAGVGYRLTVARGEPVADLSLDDRPIATLNLGSAVDTMDAADEATWLDAPTLTEEPDGAAILTWRGHSARWAAKTVTLRAWDGGFSYHYTITGQGEIDRAHFWRTRAVPAPAPAVRLFDPEPNSGLVRYTGDRCTPDKFCVMCNPARVPDRVYSGPPDFMTISVGRDKEYHDGNWFFTPSPFCYAVEGAGHWLGLGIAAAPGAWNFSEFLYPGGGFGFSLVYDGHERVDGTWRSPDLVALVAPDEYAAVEQYCAWLRTAGLAPTHGRGPLQPWWQEPIFCGWGEQVSQEVAAGGQPKAAQWATQANYERWLATLEAHDLNPGTVVIDDKWQRAYGLNDPDPAKWPDLPGFIADQHRRGRHVLLWLKAWDPEGVPPDECIRAADGTVLAVDPAHPTFRRRLAAQVHTMLHDFDADGFKIDFTHLIPRGPGAASAGGRWGLELLRQWLEIISVAARAAKPDALIITHTTNPCLADLVDMLRLNDVAGLMDPQASIVPDMRHRARIARAASPWWLLDADNWPCSTRVQWRDYIAAQASGAFGVPSLYHAERLGWGPSNDALTEEDYATVRAAWAAYRAAHAALQD
jgi:hypothetical protein